MTARIDRHAAIARPAPGPLTGAAFDPAFDGGARQMLDDLRAAARDVRAAARADLFQACAMLSPDADVSRTAHLHALMKCLPQALGKTPRMLRPGVAEISFDEAWLLRLIDTVTGDSDSFEFLIRARVVPWARRSVGSLLRGVSERFPRT